jgi:hypothetical protein
MKRLLDYNLDFYEEGHIYRVDGELKDSLTKIIKPLSNFAGIPAKNLEKAGQRGTDLHKMASLYVQGILDEQNLWDDYRPILEGLKIWKEENICEGEELISEPQLYHPKDDVCCTPDLFSSRGRLWEIKTGQWTELAVGVQTSAQSDFIFLNYGIEIKERFVLFPDKNGFFETWILKDRNDFRIWKKYLEFFKFSKLVTGRVPW